MKAIKRAFLRMAAPWDDQSDMEGGDADQIRDLMREEDQEHDIADTQAGYEEQIRRLRQALEEVVAEWENDPSMGDTAGLEMAREVLKDYVVDPTPLSLNPGPQEDPDIRF